MLYSPVQLAVYHSISVLPQLVGAPMIVMHDHIWSRFSLDIQHHARLRVLNVEQHLHTNKTFYTAGSKMWQLMRAFSKPRLRHCRQYTGLLSSFVIIKPAINTYKVRIIFRGREGFTVKSNKAYLTGVFPLGYINTIL